MRAYFEYLNSLPEPLGVMLLLVNILIASGLFAIIFYYSVKWFGRERVVRHGKYYYVVKGIIGERKYLGHSYGEPYWWYYRSHADS